MILGNILNTNLTKEPNKSFHLTANAAGEFKRYAKK